MPTSPVMIGSANALSAIEQVYPKLQAGLSAVHACVEAATIVEDDPNDLTVGYGGLPNSDGVVELDAAIMCGRTGRAGSVIGLRDVRHATQVARMVMDRTQRVMLAGEGAKRFALDHGFKEENLLTDLSRRLWLLWRRLHDGGNNWRPPEPGSPDYELFEQYRPWFGKLPTGTVHVAALDTEGNLACATSTSGHAFKMPGRVGDSPIIGAGLYADNSGGTCGSVGYGEANLLNCTSYGVVRALRDGQNQEDALRLQIAMAVDRLRHLSPTIDLTLYSLSPSGRVAAFTNINARQVTIARESAIELTDIRSL